MDSPLRRPTAGLRRTLGWAQLALTAAVVLGAVLVGHLVQGQVDARTAGADRPSATGTAVLPEVAATAPVAGSPVSSPSVTEGGAVGDGALAALGTLLVGWTLVASAGTIGRRRLDDRESERWAAEWARVEPVWSGRVSGDF